MTNTNKIIIIGVPITLGLLALLILLLFRSPTSAIEVNATLDSQPWTGSVSYTINGTTSTSGSSVTQSFIGLPIGTYTITHNSGGPPDAKLVDISPSAMVEVSANSITTFTLAFESLSSAIEVNATLDSQPWTGSVSYTINGTTSTSGSSVTQSFIGLPIGTYTITHNSGGPPGAVLVDISPSATVEVSANSITTFTLAFESPTPTIEVNATLNDRPWVGSVNYTIQDIQGPTTKSGSSVPQIFSGLPAGTYKITRNSGGPPYAMLIRILPSNTEVLSAGGTITFMLVFQVWGEGGGGSTPAPQVSGADLSLTKTVDNPNPDPGDTIIYTVTVTNNGPDDATNVEVTDALPTGVTYSSNTTTQGTYAGNIWTVGALANGASATLKITVTVDLGMDGQTITNTAGLTAADQADPDPANNQDSADITVSGFYLTIIKTVSDPFPNTGDTITYTITVTNNGPVTATSITVFDLLPFAGITYVSYISSSGTYDDSTGLWSNIADIIEGNSATLNITVIVTADNDTTITNTAELPSQVKASVDFRVPTEPD